MTHTTWTNLAYEGRAIRRAFTLVLRNLQNIEKQCKGDRSYSPNLDDMENITRIMARIANVNSAIIKVHDHDERLKNIEKLINAIPKKELEKAKLVIGQ